MFKIRHRNAPSNIIQDLFQDISDIHSHNTRLSIQVNSFSRIGTKVWNEMPVTLRNLSFSFLGLLSLLVVFIS